MYFSKLANRITKTVPLGGRVDHKIHKLAGRLDSKVSQVHGAVKKAMDVGESGAKILKKVGKRVAHYGDVASQFGQAAALTGVAPVVGSAVAAAGKVAQAGGLATKHLAKDVGKKIGEAKQFDTSLIKDGNVKKVDL